MIRYTSEAALIETAAAWAKRKMAQLDELARPLSPQQSHARARYLAAREAYSDMYYLLTNYMVIPTDESVVSVVTGATNETATIEAVRKLRKM